MGNENIIIQIIKNRPRPTAYGFPPLIRPESSTQYSITKSMEQRSPSIDPSKDHTPVQLASVSVKKLTIPPITPSIPSTREIQKTTLGPFSCFLPSSISCGVRSAILLPPIIAFVNSNHNISRIAILKVISHNFYTGVNLVCYIFV